jgi:predicted type IV restriction endonuclease
MELIKKLQNLSDTIKEYSDQDLDEANTEMSCFEPFIELLGYQRTLTNMQRQYPADIRGGTRTVDYAIKKDSVPIMIVECKRLGENLDAHIGQLREYFTAVHETRFGILTDGRLYRFYTDLDKPNLMDSDPFLEFDLFDIQPSLVTELEPFTKSRFDLDKALAAASDLKYSKAIHHFLIEQMKSPTEDFVNYIASAINITINTQERRQQITEIFQRTLGAIKGGETDPPSPDPESDKGGEMDEPPPFTGDLDSYKVLDPNETWIGKKIKAFTFEGDTHEVKSWVEFLARFCEILSEVYPNQFEEVLQLKPHHFSKNPDADFPKGMSPKKIRETDIYVQTAVNNDVKKGIVNDLVEHFECNMPVLYIDEN